MKYMHLVHQQRNKDVLHIYIYIKYTHTHTHTYTHDGILLSHKKEQNNVICSNMDGPKDGHTEWH